MLYLFRLLLLLINIDQETVLNWFGIEDSTTREVNKELISNYDLILQILNHRQMYQ
jgi:hypothetical protein